MTGTSNNAGGEIDSTRRNSRKSCVYETRVGDAQRCLHWYPGGCFLNGSLHWIVYDTESCFTLMCCFDFGKERFQPFSGPSQLCGVSGLHGVSLEQINVGVLKDGLSVFHRPTNYTLDMWMMKDYAAMESWTKDFVIKIPSPYNKLLCQPLMVLNNRDILMLYALTTLLSWNTRDRSIRKVNGISSVIRGMTYIPSFVSIKHVAAGRYS
ncbi:F-box protein CPR1-like [Rhododendron vialii]|uniref:F-box protein CPR1-like n=1 Tax=Rhododendron vialii TaxID=182163 RepID=UPI00265E08B9|nr:F-box protein CPR1-like [Rhododendron vialii]